MQRNAVQAFIDICFFLMLLYHHLNIYLAGITLPHLFLAEESN